MGTEAAALGERMPDYFCENRDGSMTRMSQEGYHLAQTTCLAVWGTSFEQRVWDADTEQLSVLMLQPTTVRLTPAPDWRLRDDS